tara:strand:+ start:679 stop:1155 length:477 start_codon:yes stop_codon:yes gene_type:complete
MAAEEAASLRLSFADAEENIATPVADFHTTQTSSAAKAYPATIDATALPLMPSTNLWVNENAKIVLLAMADATDTVESEESDGSFPIILKNIKTGAITHVKLRLGDTGRADFSGFSSTNDVVLVTTVYRRLGAYTVPSGFMATLDAGQPVHCYLGDDT